MVSGFLYRRWSFKIRKTEHFDILFFRNLTVEQKQWSWLESISRLRREYLWLSKWFYLLKIILTRVIRQFQNWRKESQHISTWWRQFICELATVMNRNQSVVVWYLHSMENMSSFSVPLKWCDWLSEKHKWRPPDGSQFQVNLWRTSNTLSNFVTVMKMITLYEH